MKNDFGHEFAERHEVKIYRTRRSMAKMICLEGNGPSQEHKHLYVTE